MVHPTFHSIIPIPHLHSSPLPPITFLPFPVSWTLLSFLALLVAYTMPISTTPGRRSQSIVFNLLRRVNSCPHSPTSHLNPKILSIGLLGPVGRLGGIQHELAALLSLLALTHLRFIYLLKRRNPRWRKQPAPRRIFPRVAKWAWIT